MKSKTQKIVILLILGLVFPLILNYNFRLNNDFKHKVDKPRTSATYDYIIIDALATTNTTNYGNWSWARAQPWCTTGDGTKEYPYIIENVTIIYPPAIDCLTIRNSRKYFIVRNCTFKDIPVASFAGIKLNNVTNANIIDNHAYNNSVGIYLDDCYYNNISGNTVSNNSLGIYLYYCYNNTVSGNTANYNDDGIYLEESDDNTISGNTANENSQNGIYSYFCGYNNITGNTANDNSDSGISFENDCNYNIISENYVNTNNYNGIYFYQCNYNTISNNLVNGSGEMGITLHWYSSNNTIVDNIANYNEQIGIELYDYCENNTVSNNVVSFNRLSGIGIYDYSNYNILTKNLLFNNTSGVYIDNGDNNSIYANFFSKNFEHAFDDGIDNKWNNTVIGNYWDNHTAPDISPQDGIVDTSYIYISGPAGSIDYLPIAEDGVPIITVNSPIEGGRFGNAAPTFSLTVTDIYLVSMWYTLDDGQHNYTFTGLFGTIGQSAWDAMSDGTITITFYVLDIAGNIGTADITIGKNIPEEFDPTIIIVIVVISIVGGVAVLAGLYIFMKKRA